MQRMHYNHLLLALNTVTFLWWTTHELALAADQPQIKVTNGTINNAPAIPRIPHEGLTYSVEQHLDFDAVEWVPTLKPQTTQPAFVYEHLASADLLVELPNATAVEVHWSSGSHSEPEDFQPHVTQLKPNEPLRLESFGGRSSDGVMPMFNLASNDGGLVIAIGWSGDWQAEFALQADGKVHFTCGLKRPRFQFNNNEPFEPLRLPSVLVMPYSGDWINGQNRFRQLMLKHYTPTNCPVMQLMPVAASVHGMIGFNDTTAVNLQELATADAVKNLPIDTFWVDAGWNHGGFPRGQGNPEIDAVRFPQGMNALGAIVESQQRRFLLWFEPERAMTTTWLDQHRSDWLLRPRRHRRNTAIKKTMGFASSI